MTTKFYIVAVSICDLECSRLFMTIYSYTTLQKVMTRPQMTIICFEIYTMMNDSKRLRWCFESFPFNALRRHRERKFIFHNKINTVTNQKLVIGLQEGCQKGIHPSNAGHPLSQSIADIIIQAKKTQKNTKIQCMHTVNMIFIMHINRIHLALMTVNYVSLAGI